MLICIETHRTCDFPGEVRTPYPPPSGSALDTERLPINKRLQLNVLPSETHSEIKDKHDVKNGSI